MKAKALQEIGKKPVLKQRLLAALKAGSLKAVEEFCKHPVASLLLEAFKAAFPDPQQQATAAQARNEQLAAKLRELGIDPDAL